MRGEIRLLSCKINNRIDIVIDVYSRITTIYGNSGDRKSYLFSVLKPVLEVDDRHKFIDYSNRDHIRQLNQLREKIIWIDNADVILSESDRIHISNDVNNYYLINCRDTTGLPVNVYRSAKIIKENNSIYLDFPYIQYGAWGE